MRFVPTKLHGMLDYLSVGTLLAVPRLLGWDKELTRFLTGAAVGTLGYSVLTRYELGVVKVLPMTAHLTFDGMSGALFCAAPLLFPEEDRATTGALVAFGVFEIGAALTSKHDPPELG